MRTRSLCAAIVSVNSPGYRSLAASYLAAAAAADARLGDVRTVRIDVDTSSDAWWTAYRILGLDPIPDVVAFPVMCWTAKHVYDTVRVLKAAAPQVRVVLGGPEVGPIASDVLMAQAGVDAVVVGEGEFAFCDLLWAWARDGDPSAVPGVVARVDGRVVVGPYRDAIEDLDSLASPYADASLATDGSTYIETYRGCPHRCAYCFEGKGSTRVRSFSWERIARDIETVASTPGMRAFSFIDPVFNLTPDRLTRLSDLLAPFAEKGLRLHTIEVDIERVDDSQAALLARAGVASVETGPQTIGAAALDNCGRCFHPDRFRGGVEACKKAGISVECDIIAGLPGDTAADVIAAYDFVTDLDPGVLQVSTLHVLPGTRLWDQAGALGLVYNSDPPHELISTQDIGYRELRRLEALGRAVATVYRARL